MDKLKNKYFFLYPHCYLVNGENGSAIYDLCNSELYGIDKSIGKIITELESNNKSLDAILNNCDSFIKENVFTYLKEIESNNLGTFYNNFVVIERLESYFSKKNSKKDHKLLHPQKIFIEIESNCNLNCRVCASKALTSSRCFCHTAGNNDNLLSIIDPIKWHEIIKEILFLDSHQIKFVGGEPLLAKDTLFNLISYIRSFKLVEKPTEIVVRTNFTLFDNQALEFLKNNYVCLETNFYSHKEDVHDWITRTSGNWRRKIDNLKLAVNYKLPVSVTIEIMKQNQDYIDDIVYFLHCLGIDNIYYDYILTTDDNFYPNKAIKNYIRSDNNLKGVTQVDFFQNLGGHPCWDRQLAITSSGDILPCNVALNEKIGNITNLGIIDVLRQKKMDKYWCLSLDCIDGCKSCEYRYACFDCRPGNSKDGSLNAKNKYCIF